MAIKPWKILESKYVLQEKWMTLRTDRCQTPAGVIVEPYYVQEPGDWVHVVAFDDVGNILTIEQYRHGVGRVCIELPCGCVESGEAPLVAAERELLEETGCQAERIEALPSMSPNPARYNSMVHPFVAFDTKVVAPQSLDSSEDIEYSFRSIAEVEQLLKDGIIVNCLHIATIPFAIEMFRKRS